MKKILINATQKEELRVAIVDGQKLIDLDIETPSSQRKKGNIYKGSIARIEPGLDAVFVDYGDPKHGFLPLREVAQAYYKDKSGGRHDASSIAKALNKGQQLLVQVQREGRGGKGAALTTFISLAGRYMVMMPNSPRSGGVSRRMDDKKRDETREVLSQLDVREGEGVIIRTKGAGRDIQSLQHDLDNLRSLWDSIIAASKGRPAPFLVYEESNIVICALRDHFSDDTEEIVVDNEAVYNDARSFIELVMPQHLEKLRLYKDSTPLFNRYHIESEIETAFDREITLPSGGSIVFDHTEALLSIDINSGRATKGSNIEETALNTNLEAAEEIARQLRLRDLGGLIVIDFIDMFSAGNRRAVETRLHQATSKDQARVQFERISRFGLLEMSRQRLRPSLSESSHLVCPRCSGKGFIRTLESSALSILRLMEEEAMKEKSGSVVAHLPTEVTTFLLNEKREKINEIEKRHNITLMIVPDIHMQIPHFKIQRYRTDDKTRDDKHSYEMIPERKPPLPRPPGGGVSQEKPAVGPAVDFMDAAARRKKDKGLIRRLFSLFSEDKPASPAEKSKVAEESGGGRRRRRRGGQRGGRAQGAQSQQQSDQADASRRQSRQSGAGGGTGDTRTSGNGRGGEAQRQSSGRSRRGRQPSSARRRTAAPDAPPTGPTGQRSDQRPDQRPDQRLARQPEQRRPDEPKRDDRPPAYATEQPHTSGSTPGRTVFTPPMPTLPERPPSQRDAVKDAARDVARDATRDAPEKPESFRKAAPPFAAPEPGRPSGPAPKGPDLGSDLGHKTGGESAEPPAYTPPRISKPENLTQIETKGGGIKPPAPQPPTRANPPAPSGPPAVPRSGEGAAGREEAKPPTASPPPRISKPENLTQIETKSDAAKPMSKTPAPKTPAAGAETSSPESSPRPPF